MQHQITLTANEASSLEDAMGICIYKICAYTKWPVGHVYLPDTGRILRSSNIWYVNNKDKYWEFQIETSSISFASGEGLPGKVLRDAKPYWMFDIANEQDFIRTNIATQSGLRGAFAFPVMEGKDVVAVLEFFSESTDMVDNIILDVVTQIATQIGRIVERKKAASTLTAAMEEAQRANEAKSVFLSSMSHELRTPLNSILGFAQLLESDSSNPLSESQKENIRPILQSGDHLLKLINEILDLSRIESGKLQVSYEDVNVDSVISESIATVGPLAQQYNIKINKQTKHDGLHVKADYTRFKQIIINLLSNAIKYNNVDGSVTISTDLPDTGTIRISVEDTGPGIAKENLELLFEPFNRLGAETLKIEGTGIGLTITKKLVEVMGGSIGVESVVGRGTNFNVDLKKA